MKGCENMEAIGTAITSALSYVGTILDYITGNPILQVSCSNFNICLPVL